MSSRVIDVALLIPVHSTHTSNQATAQEEFSRETWTYYRKSSPLPCTLPRVSRSTERVSESNSCDTRVVPNPRVVVQEFQLFPLSCSTSNLSNCSNFLISSVQSYESTRKCLLKSMSKLPQPILCLTGKVMIQLTLFVGLLFSLLKYPTNFAPVSSERVMT